jgi:NAD(P)-dependent dehydrogenase (short-subunit alcohol dehydrogenase family)
VRAVAAQAGDVRLLINNAGIVAKFGGELTDAGWMTAARDEFEVNVLGALSLTQGFAPMLAGRPGAAVVNISSAAGLAAFPAFLSYSASKAALHSLTQSTRALLAPHGVHIAGVYPGVIDTDLARPFDMVKTAPEAAVNAILDGLEDEQEEIFPDPMAQELGKLFLHDPKALEQQFVATAMASTNA